MAALFDPMTREERARVVSIDVSDVNFLHFQLTEEEQEKLIDRGVYAVRDAFTITTPEF